MTKYKITFPVEELPKERRFNERYRAKISGSATYDTRDKAEIALMRLSKVVRDKLTIEEIED